MHRQAALHLYNDNHLNLICRGEMTDLVRQQEKLCVESWAALGPNPSASTCAQPIPGRLASPAQLIEAMEDVW